MANPDPKISVIIPVKGDWPHLEACVRSILNLNYLNFDIIVVDDGLSGEAISSLEKYKNKMGILASGGKGPSYARNLAVKNTDAEFIAFTDSDCVVDKDWLINLFDGFKKNPGAVSCGGKQELPRGAGEFEKKGFLFMEKIGFLTDYLRRTRNNDIIEVNHNASCNVMYEKDVFLKEGGFLESLWPGEDVEFDYRLARKKYKLVFSPKAIVYHCRPKDLKSFSKMMYRYGWAQGFLVKKYGIYRKIQFLPLIVCAAVIVLFLTLLFGFIIYSLLGIAIGLGVIFIYFKFDFTSIKLCILTLARWHFGFLKGLLNFDKKS